MNRFLYSLAAALACVLATGGSVQAQISPYARPGYYGPLTRTHPLSPYLNLVSGGIPAVNYYLQVVPEFERRTVLGQMDAAMRVVEQRTATAVGSELENVLRNLQIAEPLQGTGHPVRFGDLSPYYNVRGVPGRPGTGVRPGFPPGRVPGP